MSTNEISLERLRSLTSTVGSSGLNLFLGAGISRDAPTCGPIWSEMQVGFLSAVFDRMEAEGWPAASDFPAQRKKVGELDVRPELFWRDMIGITGESIIWKALAAAGAGPPNENHSRVAGLLNSGRCKWAITTNFDEHVEAFLAHDVSVTILTDDMVLPELDSSTYLKLHGSIGVGPSLSYTLEHYDDLERRHAGLLKTIILGRPLVIAGYSGYDTDVLPELHSLAHLMPWIVVVRHPGSPIEQPILQLAAKRSQAYVLESTCPEALGVLTEGLVDVPSLKSASCKRNSASYYSEAVGGVGIHLCPAIMLAAFRLTGAWELVRTYAWLTHDAVTDTRYRPSISEREYQQIHQGLALCLKLAGDSTGAQIMLNESKASLDESGTGFSEFQRQLQAEALTKDAPSQLGKSSATRISMSGFKPSDIIAAGLEMAKKLGSPSKRHIFEESWKIGITRRREGSPGRAIEAFNEAAAIAFSDVVTHLERGRFLLDFGGAAFEHAVELRDDELAEHARLIFQGCDTCTRISGDWGTNARANLMLARLYTNGGSFAEAWEHIRLARLAVGRTEDSALSERIEHLADLLKDLEERFGRVEA